MKQVAKWYLLAGLVASANSYAALYEVGPGRAHEDLSTVPWLTLQAGDEVRIHWREEPYRSKIGLRGRGTESSPIVISGVINAEGLRPVLDAENAVTAPTLGTSFFSSVYDESNSLILIKRDHPEQPYGYKPGHIVIENLEIRGGYREHSYTDQFGNVRDYAFSASGIWANLVEHLVVRNNVFTDNGNGIFVLSKEAAEAVSKDVLIQGNHFYDNGTANRDVNGQAIYEMDGNGNCVLDSSGDCSLLNNDRQHNIYVQAEAVVIENNRIDALRPHSAGASLKTRGGGEVIRYNHIATAARTLDLVEPEDAKAFLSELPAFEHTWVYGNVFTAEDTRDYRALSSRMIHFGGDTTITQYYRTGTLHFNHNTFYLNVSYLGSGNEQPGLYRTSLFEIDMPQATVEASNNVIQSEGNTLFGWAVGEGDVNLSGTNLVPADMLTVVPNRVWNGTLTDNGTLISNNYAGLVDPAAGDFSLYTDSAAVAATTASNNDSVDHPVTEQYEDIAQSVARVELGATLNLGAIGDTVEGSGDTGTGGGSGDNGSGGSGSGGNGSGGSGGSGNVDYDAFTEGHWGSLPNPDGAITQVYPEPGSGMLLEESVQIELAAASSFQWTSGRTLTVWDQAGNALATIDPEEGDALEGQTVMSFTLAQLGITEPGVYRISLDGIFVRMAVAPWKNTVLPAEEWEFAVFPPSLADADPTATWGTLATPVDAITQVYPAPDQLISLSDSLQIELTAAAAFNWTAQNSLKVVAEDGTVVYEIDFREGSSHEGQTILALPLADMNLEAGETYQVLMDATAVRVNVAPWRNGAIVSGQWSFVAVN